MLVAHVLLVNLPCIFFLLDSFISIVVKCNQITLMFPLMSFTLTLRAMIMITMILLVEHKLCVPHFISHYLLPSLMGLSFSYFLTLSLCPFCWKSQNTMSCQAFLLGSSRVRVVVSKDSRNAKRSKRFTSNSFELLSIERWTLRHSNTQPRPLVAAHDLLLIYSANKKQFSSTFRCHVHSFPKPPQQLWTLKQIFVKLLQKKRALRLRCYFRIVETVHCCIYIYTNNIFPG